MRMSEPFIPSAGGLEDGLGAVRRMLQKGGTGAKPEGGTELYIFEGRKEGQED